MARDCTYRKVLKINTSNFRKNLTLKLVMFDRLQAISDMKTSNRTRREYDFVFICSDLFRSPE